MTVGPADCETKHHRPADRLGDAKVYAMQIPLTGLNPMPALFYGVAHAWEADFDIWRSRVSYPSLLLQNRGIRAAAPTGLPMTVFRACLHIEFKAKVDLVRRISASDTPIRQRRLLKHDENIITMDTQGV